MFEHFTRYPTVLPIVEYPDTPTLLASIQSAIIEPAEERVRARNHLAATPIPRVVLSRPS